MKVEEAWEINPVLAIANPLVVSMVKTLELAAFSTLKASVVLMKVWMVVDPYTARVASVKVVVPMPSWEVLVLRPRKLAESITVVSLK